MKKRILAMLLVIGSTLITDCKTGNKWFKRLSFKGVVLDKTTGASVSSVLVTLYACTDGSAKSLCSMKRMGQTASDSHGEFQLNTKAAKSDRYKLTLDAGKGEFDATSTFVTAKDLTAAPIKLFLEL